MAQQPGAPGPPPLLAWPGSRDPIEPARRGVACSLPVWSTDQETRDGGSSVSSGRLSGSSGGHVSHAPPHGPWKEQPPRGLGSQRPPRKSDPRLERLRDRIRQQARGQASCASLGTSAPSSASCLCSAPAPTPQRRTCKVTALAHSGPQDKTRRTRSRSCRRDRGAPRLPSPSRAAKGKEKAWLMTWAPDCEREDSGLVRLHPAPGRPWSGSYPKTAGSPCKSRGTATLPSQAKQTWPQSSPGKDLDAQPFPPRLQPRGPLGRSHSSEALCDFMHRKAQAGRQHALQQVAMAMDALERRSQRLQEVYQKQREAVQGKAIPVVSQTSPGIVTFVPSSAQSGVLEAPGNLEVPEQGWSKVTSGMVQGDQEVPGSFCLCLNRAWNRPETPLPVSAASSLGSPGPPDPGRGLHVCLDPQMAERLGLSGSLHAQHKQARLQALETMADVLQQRVDILTARLRQSEASGLPPLGPSTASTALACPEAPVPSRDRGSPRDKFPDAEPLPWSPGWISPESQFPGAVQLEQRLQEDLAPFQAAGTSTRSTPGVPATPHPTCGSPWLEEMLAARGVGLVTPWTPRSCGPQEPRVLRPRGRGGHLANFQAKPLNFPESLKQDPGLGLLLQREKRQQEQEQE
ncbi:coiled-coil domain-containing protein 187, partial [Octodon degus]|uniref:Coiled-coil domain-containing protein 187 n=1 Tax=Octodon degus TaxID=10160 RepID=A0A6P6D825_OCTDE